MWIHCYSALEALCDYALYKSTFTLHYITLHYMYSVHHISFWSNYNVQYNEEIGSLLIIVSSELRRLSWGTCNWSNQIRSLLMWSRQWLKMLSLVHSSQLIWREYLPMLPNSRRQPTVEREFLEINRPSIHGCGTQWPWKAIQKGVPVFLPPAKTCKL